jgi:hypothetical protein
MKKYSTPALVPGAGSVDIYLAVDVDARIAELEKALQLSKLSHYVCDDCWYSCPVSGECCDERQGAECNCGAEAHNARIDSALMGR